MKDGVSGGIDCSRYTHNLHTMNTFFSQPFNRVLGTLCLLTVTVAVAAYAYLTLAQAQYVGSGPTVITVMGEGEVFAKPDIGQFSFSVEAEGAEAAAAQQASAERTNEILTYLAEAGIAEADIKTQAYALYPKYRFEDQACPFGTFCPPRNQVQDGFTVTQTIEVKIRNLDGAGALIAGVGERGATNISGLNFTIDDPAEIEAEARALAIADAEAKAEVLADNLGVRIVRMVNFYEETNGQPIYGMGGDMMERSMAASTPSLPVGENTTRRAVNITYQVR